MKYPSRLPKHEKLEVWKIWQERQWPTNDPTDGPIDTVEWILERTLEQRRATLYPWDAKRASPAILEQNDETLKTQTVAPSALHLLKTIIVTGPTIMPRACNFALALVYIRPVSESSGQSKNHSLL